MVLEGGQCSDLKKTHSRKKEFCGVVRGHLVAVVGNKTLTAGGMLSWVGEERLDSQRFNPSALALERVAS
jgi:uncharacterized cupin superfamily protein